MISLTGLKICLLFIGRVLFENVLLIGSNLAPIINGEVDIEEVIPDDMDVEFFDQFGNRASLPFLHGTIRISCYCENPQLVNLIKDGMSIKETLCEEKGSFDIAINLKSLGSYRCMRMGNDLGVIFNNTFYMCEENATICMKSPYTTMTSVYCIVTEAKPKGEAIADPDFKVCVPTRRRFCSEDSKTNCFWINAVEVPARTMVEYNGPACDKKIEHTVALEYKGIVVSFEAAREFDMDDNNFKIRIDKNNSVFSGDVGLQCFLNNSQGKTIWTLNQMINGDYLFSLEKFDQVGKSRMYRLECLITKQKYSARLVAKLIVIESKSTVKVTARRHNRVYIITCSTNSEVVPPLVRGDYMMLYGNQTPAYNSLGDYYEHGSGVHKCSAEIRVRFCSPDYLVVRRLPAAELYVSPEEARPPVRLPLKDRGVNAKYFASGYLVFISILISITAIWAVERPGMMRSNIDKRLCA